MKLNKWHKYTVDSVREHWSWFVENAHGIAHLHITKFGAGIDNHSGGIEQHRRSPRDGSDDAPTHTYCDILKGPCWHDGSSCAAEQAVDLHKRGLLSHEHAFQIAAGLLPTKDTTP
jgi:hypothetical protein